MRAQIKNIGIFMKFRNFAMICAMSSCLVACGVENNISFNTTEGNCADGTTGAPYCMQVTIQNNSGGQNYINSTNFPISNLQIEVTSAANNVNYPVTSGSTLDPNGCLNSTVAPGGTCSFFLQLTGESVPVGKKQVININANYTINSTLFGTSSQTASSSTSLYQRPSLISTNSSGRAINYSESGISSVYAAESGYATVVANANDNYYGFLYLATNNGLYLSGNQTYQYNMIESITGVNNIVINGTNAYPVSTTSTIYSSSLKPLSSLYWSFYASTPNANTVANTAIMGGGKLFLTDSYNVYLCNSSTSLSGGCIQEGITTSGITALGYTTLGQTASAVPLTGLVIGTKSGLFVESGSLGSNANGWVPVYLSTTTSTSINSSISKIITDNNQNLYISDTNNTIYKMGVGSGNYATSMATIDTNSYGNISAMVYDNAGQVLYVGTSGGYLMGCIPTNGLFDCGPVATNIFVDNLFGLNIVSTISQS